jgi:hypothetical protein
MIEPVGLDDSANLARQRAAGDDQNLIGRSVSVTLPP